jgi:hypothetical protein
MGDLVNLRKVRKTVKRKLEQERAATNRLLHGQTKGDRALDAARKAKAARELEQHRVETGDDR